jgi:hypothetical protein
MGLSGGLRMKSSVRLGQMSPKGAACHGISRARGLISTARAAKEALMRPFILTTTLIAALSSPALALVPINEEPVIVDKLLQGFIGDIIAKNCPTMEPRTLRALGELNALRDYALEQGYSADEVREFIRSGEEKKKFKVLAAEWLAERGAEPGNPDAYCRIGEEEIAKDSLLGRLLRSKK